MYNQLIEINNDGNVMLQDHSIALMPKMWEVYKHKRMGSKMVKWIVSMYDYKSPYRRLPISERKREVTYNIFGKPNFALVNDSLVNDAIREYDKLQFDPLIHQYNAMINKAYEVTIVYESIETDDKNLSKLNKMQKEMKEAAESREKIKELIKKNQEDEVKVHGGSLNDLSLLEQKNERKRK
jgi:hypothetical protein